MKFDAKDMYAALMHEIKNNLGLLTMNLDAIPASGEADRDKRLDDARLLCQRSVERLQQALLIYKSANGELHPVVDAYSPREMLQELRDTALSLTRDRLKVETLIGDDVPVLGFFDRTLVAMALTNAVHNSLAHAQSAIRIEAEMVEGCLAFTVRDDSPGYPRHILESGAGARPFSSSGTGLGLRFARMIAEAHENDGRFGDLRLFNENGAVFRLLLP